MYSHALHLSTFTKASLFLKAKLKTSHYNFYKNRNMAKIYSFRFAFGTPQF